MAKLVSELYLNACLIVFDRIDAIFRSTQLHVLYNIECVTRSTNCRYHYIQSPGPLHYRITNQRLDRLYWQSTIADRSHDALYDDLEQDLVRAPFVKTGHQNANERTQFL